MPPKTSQTQEQAQELGQQEESVPSEQQRETSQIRQSRCGCANIDIDRLLKPKLRDKFGARDAGRACRFDPPQQVTRVSSCSFCRLLAVGSGEDAFAPVIKSLSWHNYGKGRNLRNKVTNVCGFETDTENSRRILPLGDDVHKINRKPANYARLLKGNVANLGLIRQWINRCSQTHSLCSTVERNILQRRELPKRLLDTKKMEVVLVRKPVEFFALSYVCGSSIQPTIPGYSTQGSDGDPISVHNITLPQVMQDAIKLTNDLNGQYLWIDALCIHQVDPEERQSEVARMNDVYLGAKLTIVAMTANDANDSLPGIDEYVPARVQGSESWAGLRFATVAPSASEIYSSPTCRWNSRAWTMQEHVFSRRLLFLGPEQAYFSCNTATYSEDKYESDDDGSYVMYQHPGRLLLHPSTHYSKVSLRVWKTFTESYCRRTSTHNVDRFLAFQGILQEQNTSWSIDCREGLPLNYLPQTLLWHFKPDSSPISDRIESYPSWSWIGWTGEVVFPLWSKFRPAFAQAHIQEGVDKHIVDFDRNGHILNQRRFPLARLRDRLHFRNVSSVNEELDMSSLTIGKASHMSQALLTLNAQCVTATVSISPKEDGTISIHDEADRRIGRIENPRRRRAVEQDPISPTPSTHCTFVLIGTSDNSQDTKDSGRRYNSLWSRIRDSGDPLDSSYSRLQFLGQKEDAPSPQVIYPVGTPQRRRYFDTENFWLRNIWRLSFVISLFWTTLAILVILLLAPLFNLYVALRYPERICLVMWIEDAGDGFYRRKGVGQLEYKEFQKLKPQRKKIQLI